MAVYLLLLLSIFVSYTQELSLGGESLYSPDDKIVLLNNTNFESVVCGSDRAWLIEFYSSWCGHCIHFAPTFKQFALNVEGWKDVITVGAIDCAQDANIPTCRNYEVMGYPTIKFFAPQTKKGDAGLERTNRQQTIDSLRRDMINFVLTIQTPGKDWPDLQSYSGAKLKEALSDKSTKFKVLLLDEDEESTLSYEVMLEMNPSLKKFSVPVKLLRVVIPPENDPEREETRNLIWPPSQHSAALQLPAVVVVGEDLVAEQINNRLPFNSRGSWTNAIKELIWSHSKELGSKASNILAPTGNKTSAKTNENMSAGRSSGPTRKEIMTRRYRVHLSDLEKTIVYAISHEVAQHSAVAGSQLTALQKFVSLLANYFPARPEMETFLQDLNVYVHKHEDAIKGETLAGFVGGYVGDHGIKVNSEWVGCKGSKAQFGGYPCGLWSLWHTLTISQYNLKKGDPDLVMRTMHEYIREFFGCRECARHFQQTINDGKGIDENVDNYENQVLYLWKVHNKVNVRLHGDISEDPAFPKQIFPAKEFCTPCYGQSFNAGTNLWDEFDHKAVLEFLLGMYSNKKLSHQGIPSDEENLVGGRAGIKLGDAEKWKDFQDDELLDKDNYRAAVNNTGAVNFFNTADISFILALWMASAGLLFIIYMKFCAKRRWSPFTVMSRIKRKSSSGNPLIGRV